MVVALAVGRKGIDDLLVGSQVALSIVLPFVTFPLVFLTSSKKIMTVRRRRVRSQPTKPSADQGMEKIRDSDEVGSVDEENADDYEYVDYSNSWYVATFGYAIWLFIVVADIYSLSTLGT